MRDGRVFSALDQLPGDTMHVVVQRFFDEGNLHDGCDVAMALRRVSKQLGTSVEEVAIGIARQLKLPSDPMQLVARLL